MKNACCRLVSNDCIKHIYGRPTHSQERRRVRRCDRFAVMLNSDVLHLCKNRWIKAEVDKQGGWQGKLECKQGGKKWIIRTVRPSPSINWPWAKHDGRQSFKKVSQERSKGWQQWWGGAEGDREEVKVYERRRGDTEKENEQRVWKCSDPLLSCLSPATHSQIKGRL